MKHLILGISGGSGSGKTAFIHALRKQFDESKMCIISQDEYYKPIQQQARDLQGIENFDLPESIDHKAMAEDIHMIRQGREVVRKEYVFNNPEVMAGTKVFKPAPIIVIEGLFVFYVDNFSKLFDLKIFINAKENLKVIRRIKRDQLERNYPIDDVLYRYEHHVLPTYEKYVRPFFEDVEIVINNNHSFQRGLEVLSGYLKNFLHEDQEMM